MKSLSVIILGFLVWLALGQRDNALSGKIVGVHDGDSVTLLTSAKETVKLRLEGIDAPESKQPFGTAAKKTLSDMVFGEAIKFDALGEDRYGRTLARIYKADGTDVNLSMVKQGMAWHFEKYSQEGALKKAQAEAKAAKMGLWAQEAIPPWEWRKKKPR
jgi:micrococcal nuclease